MTATKQTISDVRVTTTGNSVCATVKGRNARQLAERFGVRIGPGRYWFTMPDNWETFLEECDRDAKQD